MARALWSLVIALTAALQLACAGMPWFGRSWNNVAACRDYVRAYNALSCIEDHERLDPHDNCPSSLDDVPCDLSEYYACMAPRTVCRDGRPDVSAHRECGDRSCM